MWTARTGTSLSVMNDEASEAWGLVVQIDDVVLDPVEGSTQQRLVVVPLAIPPCRPGQKHLLHGLLPAGLEESGESAPHSILAV